MNRQELVYERFCKFGGKTNVSGNVQLEIHGNGQYAGYSEENRIHGWYYNLQTNTRYECKFCIFEDKVVAIKVDSIGAVNYSGNEQFICTDMDGRSITLEAITDIYNERGKSYKFYFDGSETGLYKIFYAWQSDEKKWGEIISEALKELENKQYRGGFRVKVHYDMREELGSPEISKAIFSKIDKADLFVGDLNIINSSESGRKNMNPNVLLETGYAIRALGWEKIILICRDEDVNDQPFDIRNHRYIRLIATNGKKECIQQLISVISDTLERLDQREA